MTDDEFDLFNEKVSKLISEGVDRGIVEHALLLLTKKGGFMSSNITAFNVYNNVVESEMKKLVNNTDFR